MPTEITPAARTVAGVEAAARIMREQAADPVCRRHQVAWEELAEERRQVWRLRAGEVLDAADSAA